MQDVPFRLPFPRGGRSNHQLNGFSALIRPLSTDFSPLPDVAGGWTTDVVDLGFCALELVRPALPDALLDDPLVLEANRLDDYMPYWSYLWPAAVPMARSLAHAAWPPGARVLELGSGIGLVGLAALARGWDVTFSDYDETSLALCRLNALRNGFPAARTLRLDWRAPTSLQFPVILGCEVIYERRNHAPILDVLDRMLAPAGCCWIGDPGRTQAPPFCELARSRGYAVAMRDERGALRSAYRQQFCLFELRRERD